TGVVGKTKNLEMFIFPISILPSTLCLCGLPFPRAHREPGRPFRSADSHASEAENRLKRATRPARDAPVRPPAASDPHTKSPRQWVDLKIPLGQPNGRQITLNEAIWRKYDKEGP